MHPVPQGCFAKQNGAQRSAVEGACERILQSRKSLLRLREAPLRMAFANLHELRKAHSTRKPQGFERFLVSPIPLLFGV